MMIFRRESLANQSNMDNIMENYLKQYSCGNDLNNSSIHARSQVKISNMNEGKQYY